MASPVRDGILRLLEKPPNSLFEGDALGEGRGRFEGAEPAEDLRGHEHLHASARARQGQNQPTGPTIGQPVAAEAALRIERPAPGHHFAIRATETVEKRADRTHRVPAPSVAIN